MKSKLFLGGVIATAGYAALILVAFGAKIPGLLEMELNAVGDFLAGAFSPLAFLWLVLGFMQQGQELKISSDALVEQAKELKSSVKQQEAMVGIAARQLQTELDSIHHEREVRFKESLPKVRMGGHIRSSGSGEMNLELELVNHGGTAYELALFKDDKRIFEMYSFPNGAIRTLKISLPYKDCLHVLRVEHETERGVFKEDFVLSVSLADRGNSIARVEIKPKVRVL